MLAAVLSVPEMAVAAVGGALQVTFKELPLTAVVSVTVWKRDEEQQVRVHFTSLVPSFSLLPFLLFLLVSNFVLPFLSFTSVSRPSLFFPVFVLSLCFLLAHFLCPVQLSSITPATHQLFFPFSLFPYFFILISSFPCTLSFFLLKIIFD